VSDDANGQRSDFAASKLEHGKKLEHEKKLEHDETCIPAPASKPREASYCCYWKSISSSSRCHYARGQRHRCHPSLDGGEIPCHRVSIPET
jgi:hypothetical protein